jgi:hypothetical protein
MGSSHVLLVDYGVNNLDILAKRLELVGVIPHKCISRIDALGKLWELVSNHIIPRGVISSWLLDDPEGREFYSLIGREIDHTSLSLFRNAAKLDPRDTILICYTNNLPETCGELNNEIIDNEIDAELQRYLGDIVFVVDLSKHKLEEAADLFIHDERLRTRSAAARKFKSEVNLHGLPEGFCGDNCKHECFSELIPARAAKLGIYNPEDMNRIVERCPKARTYAKQNMEAVITHSSMTSQESITAFMSKRLARLSR